MALGTGTAANVLRPEQVGPLIVQPVQETSVAMQVSTVVSALNNAFRIPVVTADAHAAWTAEGADIAADDANVDELDIVPLKIAALSKISRELAADSTPEAATVVGDGFVRQLARRVDEAFFGSSVANGPNGLASASGVQTITVGELINLDPFAEAQANAETVGAEITAFCASPATVLALSKLKAFTGTTVSNQPLLTAGGSGDSTEKITRSILGTKLWSVPGTAIAPGVIWAIPMERTFVVLRSGADLTVDNSFYFGSDSVAIRATMRVGFGFPHTAAITKISAGTLS